MKNKQIEALRGILILMIIIFHYTFRFTTLYNVETIDFFSLSKWGEIGVGGFFIISGFFLLPQKKEKFGLKKFWTKKFLRLYPAYILCMTITFISTTIFGLQGRETKITEYLLNIPLINGFIGVNYVDGAHWYITYLLIFYVIIGIFLKLNVPEKIFLPVWLILKDILKVITTLVPNISPIYNLIGGEYVEFIIIGISLSKILKEYMTINKIDKSIYVLSIITSIIQIFALKDATIGIAIILFIFIFVLAATEKLKLLEKIKGLIFMGEISYIIYLIHQNIGFQIILSLYNKLGKFNILIMIITMIIIIAISIFIDRYYAKPIQSKISEKLKGGE